MHIHATALNSGGNALAGAHAVETSAALRRARELRKAADHLKATSLGSDLSTDSDSVAMIAAWSGSGHHAPASDSGEPATPRKSINREEVQTAAPASPVSFWA
jgi:hypothetical protein